MTRQSSIGAIIIAVAGFAGGIWWNQPHVAPQASALKQSDDSSWPFAGDGSGPSVVLEAEPFDFAADSDTTVGRARIDDLSGDDQHFFPSAINDDLGVARVEDVDPFPNRSNVIDLTDAERQVWDNTLDKLSAKQREELINIRNRVGSVATPLLPSLGELNGEPALPPIKIQDSGEPNENTADTARVSPSAVPPSLFPTPQDDSLVELLSRPISSDVVLVGAQESPSPLLSAAEQLHRESLLNQMTIGYKRSELIVTSPLAASDLHSTTNVVTLDGPPRAAISEPQIQNAKSKSGNATETNSKSETNPNSETQNGAFPTAQIASKSSRFVTGKWMLRLDTSAGQLKQTGNPLDIAIHGQGWLKIQLVGGKVGYTRAGVLGIGKERRLCVRTSDGLLPLLPTVTLPKNVSVSINALGDVTTSTLGAEPQAVGTIQLFGFHDPTQLKRHHNGCLVATELSGEAFEIAMKNGHPSSAIKQGALELSNANEKNAQEQLSKLRKLAEALR